MGKLTLANLKGRDLFLVTVLFFAVLGLAWYYGMYSGTKAEIDQKRTQVETLETQVMAARAAAAELPRLEQQVAEMEVQTRELLQALPSTARIGLVLQEVRGNMLVAGADMNSVSQSAPQAANLPAGVKSIGINLNVAGTFGEMYRVLRSLEDMSRFSLINNFTVNVGQADSLDPTLNGTIGMTVYTYDAPVDAVAAPATPGTAQPGQAPAPAAPPAGGEQ